MGNLAAVLVPLVVVAGLDAWVYVDASGRRGTAREVSVTIAGRVTIDQPATWLVGCVVLFVMFFPLYLLARRHAGE